MDGNAGGFGGGMFFIIIIGVMILFMFMSSRSQKKAQEMRQSMLKSIKAGDEIETVARQIGKVLAISGERVTIDVGPDSRHPMQMVVHIEGIMRVLKEEPKLEENKS
ncbi:MAG: preprotein translocase subunit YajC [Proteobacteria bacterium]|nr:preprotein translocase subunit YajC [Pseudomonadota bacterium]